jgi:D-beta-D-heptose 7-phosphate kinase/D-beta-D-heptose 1-phosphate adenosyltransferase
MDLSALQSLLASLSGVRVACVGDLMVDRFVYGEVTRVSPEAPIPIMAWTGESVMLGGAGNVARNVAALGGAAALVGVVGADVPAHEATRLLEAELAIEGSLVTDTSRPTTVKARFVSGGQQLLRVDVEQTNPVGAETEEILVRAVRNASVGAGAILLSDYGKGVVTEAVIEACLDAAKANGAMLIVDSKARSFAKYGAADIIKPNAAELARATDMPTDTDAEVEAALTRAFALCHSRAILTTRSEKGLSLGLRDGSVRHFVGAAREVFDTSGAGDTVLAAMGLALAAGAKLEAAADFALLASGVVVGKAGTAVVAPAELIEAELSAHRAPVEAKIATVELMRREIARWRELGLRVGFTNGCFDILHRGHVAYLAQAKSWCDRLVVGLNSDRSVRALKGEGRPFNDLESRALVLAGLGSVDLIVPFDQDTPIELIAAAHPDVLIKGADYTVDAVVGHELVESYGGEVKLAAIVEGYSTTAALRKLSEQT